MSFGTRGKGPVPPSRTATPVRSARAPAAGGRTFETAEEALAAADSAPIWKGQIAKYAGVLAGILLLHLSFWPFMSLIGGGVAASRSANAAPGEMVFDLPVKGVSQLVADRNHALRIACLPQGWNQKDGWQAQNRMIHMSMEGVKFEHQNARTDKFHVGFSTGEQILACLLTKHVERLCEPAERQKLAGEIVQFAAAHKSKAEEFDRIMKLAGGSGSYSVGMMQAVSEGGGAIDTGGTALNRINRIDIGLLKKISSLSIYGRLDARDFGKALPADVKPYIEETVINECKT